MKKVFLLTLIAFAGFTVASAQNLQLPRNWKDFSKSTDKGTFHKEHKSYKRGGAVEGWYEVGDFVDNNKGSATTNTAVFLFFPDSTVVQVNTDNTIDSIGFHGIGHVYDLRHDGWEAADNSFGYSDSYTWDSLFFLYQYRRNYPDQNVVDTLFIHYYKSSISGQITTGTYSGNSGAFSKPNGFNTNTLSGQSYFKVDTMFLHLEDTTSFNPSTGWGSRALTQFVGVTIPASTSATGTNNSLFGYTIAFRPGHPYNLYDTMESRGTQRPAHGINYFGMGVIELNQGIGNTGLASNTRTDNSCILLSRMRYGGSANGWTGYLPGTAYLNSAIYANGGVHVTGQSTYSIDDVKKNGFALGTSYPNPAVNGQSIYIDYGMQTSANISIEVYDLLGKKVATIINNEATEAGSHTAKYDVNLPAGVYVYTMTADNTVIGSKKFTVAR